MGLSKFQARSSEAKHYRFRFAERAEKLILSRNRLAAGEQWSEIVIPPVKSQIQVIRKSLAECTKYQNIAIKATPISSVVAPNPE